MKLKILNIGSNVSRTHDVYLPFGCGVVNRKEEFGVIWLSLYFLKWEWLITFYYV